MNTSIRCFSGDPGESKVVWIVGHRQKGGKLVGKLYYSLICTLSTGKWVGQQVAPPHCLGSPCGSEQTEAMFKVAPSGS